MDELHDIFNDSPRKRARSQRNAWSWWSGWSPQWHVLWKPCSFFQRGYIYKAWAQVPNGRLRACSGSKADFAVQGPRSSSPLAGWRPQANYTHTLGKYSSGCWRRSLMRHRSQRQVGWVAKTRARNSTRRVPERSCYPSQDPIQWSHQEKAVW